MFVNSPVCKTVVSCEGANNGKKNSIKRWLCKCMASPQALQTCRARCRHSVFAVCFVSAVRRAWLGEAWTSVFAMGRALGMGARAQSKLRYMKETALDGPGLRMSICYRVAHFLNAKCT